MCVCVCVLDTGTASKMENAALTQRLRTLESDGAAAALQDAWQEEEQRGNGWIGFPDHQPRRRGKEGVRGDGDAGGRDAGFLLDDQLHSLVRPGSGGVCLCVCVRARMRHIFPSAPSYSLSRALSLLNPASPGLLLLRPTPCLFLDSPLPPCRPPFPLSLRPIPSLLLPSCVCMRACKGNDAASFGALLSKGLKS